MMIRNVFAYGLKNSARLGAVLAAVFAVSAFAQDGADDVIAKVPVKMANAAATVSIQPPSGMDAAGDTRTIQSGDTDTLTLILNKNVSVMRGKQSRASAGAAVSYSRGNVSLKLHTQSYQNATVSLYSINGRRIMHGKLSKSMGTLNVSRTNVARGVYLLSVKGTKGNVFTTRLTHDGGRMNINAGIGGEGSSSLSKQAKSADDYGTWTITATAAGYKNYSATFSPAAGENGLRTITMEANDDVGMDIACADFPAESGIDLSKEDLGRDAAVVVKFNGNSDAEVSFYDKGSIFNPGSVITWTVNGGHVKIKSLIANNPDIPQVDVVISGSTDNGSIEFEFTEKFGVYLNGATIKNPNGPALNSVKRKMMINVVGGCDKKSHIEGKGLDGVTFEGNSVSKGAIFSQGAMEIRGGGYLTVVSTDKHAVISDGDIEVIENVNLMITRSEGDGIHANNDINIKSGKIRINSVGDAIQSERNDSKTMGISIYGGDIALYTSGVRSHGLAAEKDVNISGSNTKLKINVTGDAAKGIRSRRMVTILDGDIDMTTSGNIAARDPEDDPTDTTSSAAGVRAAEFEMKGGKLTSVNTGENSKGLNIDGYTMISGGTLNIKAHGDAIKVDGNMTATAAARMTLESETKKCYDVKGTANIAPPVIVSCSGK